MQFIQKWLEYTSSMMSMFLIFELEVILIDFVGLKTKLSSQRLKKSLIKSTELLKMINFCELKCI